MTIDLTLYLMRDDVQDVDAVIPQEKLGAGGFEPVRKREDFQPDGDWMCWAKRKEPADVAWLPWASEGFDFDARSLQTQSAGLVIAVKVDDRVFAACFGTGYHAISKENIESGFGLTVALHLVKPNRIRGLITKTLSFRTRHRDTSYTQGAEIQDFDFEEDLEWLRTAEGQTSRIDCKVVAGSDSLKLSGWTRRLSDLPPACSEFLSIYQRGLPEAFAFVDSVMPVPKHDPRHLELEGDLAAAIEAAMFENISLQLDPGDYREARRFVVKYLAHEQELADLSDNALAAALNQLISDVPSLGDGSGRQGDRVKFFVEKEGDELVGGPLKNYLHMQVDRGGEWFVRVEGRWFRCGAEYMENLDRRVAALPNLTDALRLPCWDKAVHEKEGKYNESVAGTRNWLLQDHGAGVPLYQHGAQNLEPCDLLTEEGHFIHLKDGAGSADVTYALSQASGAADLLSRHRPFRVEMESRYQTKWPGKPLPERPTFVVAVGRHRGLSLFGNMLLSKISALEHARRIQRRGFNFAVCQFEVVEKPTTAAAPTPPSGGSSTAAGAA